MAFSVTALQLVNRVHRRRRMPDVGSITETEDLATLDAINHAVSEVLGGRTWEFDMRRAQITLRPFLTGGTVDATAGESTAVYTRSSTIDTDSIYGDYITRMQVTGSTSVAETAFRVISGSPISTVAALTLATSTPETLAADAATLFYAEYILPDTVRDVLRVTHQEEALTLNQVDPVVEFDELYPRPIIETGRPETISIGGFDVPTYLASLDEPAPSLRMIVWPVPDAAYVLDYSYHYRHPELAAATDTLDGVPPAVVDQIVEMASADMKASYEKDYDALRLRAFSQSKLDRLHSQQGGMYADRKPVGNWDGSAGRYRGETSWLRGRTIGGG